MKRVLPYISFTVAVFLLVLCMAAQAATPDNEVKALREIAEQLKKKDWNFDVDPCANKTSWFTPKLDSRPLYSNSLICNCSNPDGVCHVVELSIDNNMFSGTIPHELGKLVNLKNLSLSANNLTGELPVALTKLIKLTEFRISSINCTGRMADLFQSWNRLQILEIQASGFEGPIPSSISTLRTLTEPDLSFNRLEGRIPDLGDLTALEFMYLTSNFLNGTIPEWIKSRDNRFQIDLSYNNLSKHSAPSCREN
ncbi:hypothetical protein SO802_006571, partial [Lithocarpus litseifolius]